uniref:Endonuclease/exonuclease/phosphatase domain-containing protein n=1 Tax=Globodera rostochiensis TaxID=31243 RepID=A0A914I743_GLORO
MTQPFLSRIFKYSNTFHFVNMPAVNRARKEAQHIKKLRAKAPHSESIVKKTAPTTKKFADKKRQLEESFSNINAELVSQSQLPHNTTPPGYNVFMDILKIRQVIELDDEEQSHGLNGELSANREHKNPRRLVVVAEHNSEEILLKKRRRSTSHGKSAPDDIDLRCLPSSSTTPAPVQLQPPNGGDGSVFISRARFDARANSIDLRMRYKLQGLRYFQDIPGQDLRGDVIGATSSFDKKTLKVVSFNVLCQQTMDKMPHLYTHLRRNPILGQWEQRKDILLIEFDRLDADVFCLQEVQDIHYTQHFLPYFTARGYKSLFTPRKGLDMPDGCATFWRSDHLKLIKSNPVYYNLGVNGMHKDNVGQVFALALVGTQSAICISNTHIFYNMKHGQIKLAQMAFLLCSMHEMESQICADARQFVHFAGHILCGDFNMIPTTPLHRFMIERSVDLYQIPAEMAQLGTGTLALKGQNSLPVPLQLPVRHMKLSPKCTFVDKEDTAGLLDLKTMTKLTHSFNFASVYEHCNLLGEPEVSIYHKKEAEAPDFIFYSVAEHRDIFGDGDKQKSESMKKPLLNAPDRPLAYESYIRLVKRLSMPTCTQLDRSCGPLPNAEHGSDHLSLWACFELIVVPRRTIPRLL